MEIKRKKQKPGYCLMNSEGKILGGIPALGIFSLEDGRGFDFANPNECASFLKEHSQAIGEKGTGMKPAKGFFEGHKFSKTRQP